MRWLARIGCLLVVLIGDSLFADGPADNQAENVRPVPPPGIEVPEERKQALQIELAKLEERVAKIASSKSSLAAQYLPDVEIFSRAVALAIRDGGFYEPGDVDRAFDLLKEGTQRAEQLENGSLPWRSESRPGMYATVRGFRSKLDGTVQPYGVVADSLGVTGSRADVWCRGRSEKGLELQFLATRMKNFDPIPASGVIMIHPFGRYCNANKLAGEIDTLEAIEHAVKEYDIDPRRIAIRGFSMGGAAAWHLAVHYPDRWFAANPGAGFSETPDFLKVFQSESLQPYWFEQTLWQAYDCPVWVRNLRMLPTIAYSGEMDKQKQAADIMAKASWSLPESERFELTHLIAPKTGHQVAPAARDEIERRLKSLDQLRSEASPRRFAFTTTTLRYNKAHWLTIEALQDHWVPSTIRGELGDDSVNISIDGGVRQFAIELAASDLHPSVEHMRVVIVDLSSQGKPRASAPITIARRSDRTWGGTFRLEKDGWVHVSPLEQPSNALRKKHMLQGPIDDAFLGPFLFVRPSGKGNHAETDAWVQSEFDRAVREWGRQMRGDARIKTSEELTPEDFQNYHLVLWGDPKSNPTISKILDKLPLEWTTESIRIRERSYDAQSHVPVMIYPSPVASDRYVVLNSGFTYREYDYLNNARQVPKLPDWAIVDITTKPNARWPGRIADADFFDESWQFKPLRPLLAK